MKLNLAIVDSDTDYLRALEHYLMNNFSQRFHVSFFTQIEYLWEVLDKEDHRIDILLINPLMYTEAIEKSNIKLIILLIEGILSTTLDGFPYIKKYQLGNQIAASILNLYIETYPNQYLKPEDKAKTTIIGVYSPVGGSGKTTIAILASYIHAQRGKSVFYLNLENVPSTAVYFEDMKSQNISNLFYYLKNKKKNILLKIEGVRQFDTTLGIHYFPPVERLADFEEISWEEIVLLVNTLKESNQYDYIIIDFDSGINMKKWNQISLCNRLLLVLNQDISSQIKGNSFIKEIDRFSADEELFSKDNIQLVINKADDTVGGTQLSINNKKAIYLPYINGLSKLKGSAIINNLLLIEPLSNMLKLL
ncbi:AAA family ATPase [Alkaliphilus peptidifermentans]|uniref:MinD-like ATPase involved in chromosome partitioning or flagellar assembly n=1 Tax=Alkaliphilus peptidifermentans DSM 18978 TaxID=1120976 RepID=A0A1G5J9E7_9FIRM|nr:AAA family ATPase [Alkaliphilus peptidifermentans]SCY84540.1 MinD-like ATPase involved in chromosome partitioning or flagellar assembly [Alkaliphilus peptidifermentans DSM 18978]